MTTEVQISSHGGCATYSRFSKREACPRSENRQLSFLFPSSCLLVSHSPRPLVSFPPRSFLLPVSQTRSLPAPSSPGLLVSSSFSRTSSPILESPLLFFSLSTCLKLHSSKRCLLIMASLINPTSIPRITVLRKELDYGDPQLPRCQAFYDSVRVFRKTFLSSQGWDGNSINDWKSREHQTALGEMVRSYLELHGNGRVFWPDDDSQSRANKYKYSTDGPR